MRRLPRILLNMVTVLSLVLCVATVVLWARSYHAADSLSHVEAGPYRGTDFVAARRGSLIFHSGQLDSPATDVPALTSRRFGYQSIPLQGVADPTKNPGIVMWAGFGRGEFRYSIGYPRGGTMRVFVVPLYVVTLIFAVLPLRWLLARLKVWRALRRAGLCPSCGYDLRATPDRCPECGAVPKAVTA